MVKWDNKQKLYIFATEIFKELKLEDELKFRYAISNFGRLVSFTKNIEYGRILNGGITEGYRIFRYRINYGKIISYRHKFFCRLVAENFLEKTSDKQIYVLHLDHNLSNDLVSNLKWATKQEMLAHQRTNPKVLKSRKISAKRLVEYNKKRDGYKLTTTQVIHIKKLLANPNRKTRMKIIARRFGISEMQLYRIKTGENWGHVQIDNQTTALKTGKPAEENIEKNERPITGKKVALTQKSNKEPTKRKIEEAWDENLKAYQNGERSARIRKWISRNRKKYREDILPAEEYEKLTEINFPFEPVEAAPKIKKTNSSWDRQLEKWKKGDRKSVPIQQWKQRSIRRFVEGKLSRDRIVKLKEVGILK